MVTESKHKYNQRCKRGSHCVRMLHRFYSLSSSRVPTKINSLNRLIIRTLKEEILLVVIHVGVKTGIKRKTCHDKGTGTNIYI